MSKPKYERGTRLGRNLAMMMVIGEVPLYFENIGVRAFSFYGSWPIRYLMAQADAGRVYLARRLKNGSANSSQK